MTDRLLLFHGGANPLAEGLIHFTTSVRLAWYYTRFEWNRPAESALWVGWFYLPPLGQRIIMDAGGLTMYGDGHKSFMEKPGRQSLTSIVGQGETAIVHNVRDPHILSTVVATTEPHRFTPICKIPRAAR